LLDFRNDPDHDPNLDSDMEVKNRLDVGGDPYYVSDKVPDNPEIKIVGGDLLLLPRDARSAKRGIAIVSRPPVCLSDRLKR